jgi:hypothetical protein
VRRSKEVAPIRHCKGVNDLNKVVLREVQGSSAEVPFCHSRESPGMSWCLPWCCSKPDFSVAALAFSLPYAAYVYFRCFRCMLQLFYLDVAKVDRGMLHMLQVF